MNMLGNQRISENFTYLLENIFQENSSNYNVNKVKKQIEQFVTEHLDYGYTFKKVTTVMLEDVEYLQIYLSESNQLTENRDYLLTEIKGLIKGLVKAPVRVSGYVAGLKDRATTAFGRAYGKGYASGRGREYTGRDTTPTGFSSGREEGEQEVIARRAQRADQQQDRVTVNTTEPNYSQGSSRVTVGAGQTQNLYRQSSTGERQRRQADTAERQRRQTAAQFMRTARQSRQAGPPPPVSSTVGQSSASPQMGSRTVGGRFRF